MVDETIKSVKKQFAGTLMAVGAATVILSLVVGYFGASRALARPGIEANIKKIEDAAAVAGEFAELDKKFALKDHPHDFPVPPVLDLSTLVPIGSIIAWHPQLFGLANDALPTNWVRCDGQTVPLGGGRELNVPDLNGEGRFLRGGDASGIPQDATTISTAANCGYLAFPTIQDNDGSVQYPGVGIRIHLPKIGDQILKEPALDCWENGPRTRTGQKVRPVNVSVVWIMRVK